MSIILKYYSEQSCIVHGGVCIYKNDLWGCKHCTLLWATRSYTSMPWYRTNNGPQQSRTALYQRYTWFRAPGLAYQSIALHTPIHVCPTASNSFDGETPNSLLRSRLVVAEKNIDLGWHCINHLIYATCFSYCVSTILANSPLYTQPLHAATSLFNSRNFLNSPITIN